jgi:hypothetical protein
MKRPNKLECLSVFGLPSLVQFLWVRQQPTWRCSTPGNAPDLTLEHYAMLERLLLYKHSSLFGSIHKVRRKKFFESVRFWRSDAWEVSWPPLQQQTNQTTWLSRLPLTRNPNRKGRISTIDLPVLTPWLSWLPLTGNPYWKARITTIDLPVLTNSDQLL